MYTSIRIHIYYGREDFDKQFNRTLMQMANTKRYTLLYIFKSGGLFMYIFTSHYVLKVYEEISKTYMKMTSE